jgi:hypothetical protein
VEDMTVSITGTDKFKRHFSNIFEYFESAKDTLVEVIFSQKRALDYNGYYNAFLMNQLTEEEFLKIAEEFIYSPKIIDIKILISKISILMDLTKIDYSTSELADIFQCNNERIMEAIKQINNNNHIEGIK